MSNKTPKRIMVGDNAAGLAKLRPVSGIQTNNAGGLAALKPKPQPVTPPVSTKNKS